MARPRKPPRARRLPTSAPPSTPQQDCRRRPPRACRRAPGIQAAAPAALFGLGVFRRVLVRNACSCGPLDAGIRVEVAAVAGGGDEAGANGEIAEAFALLPPGGVGGENRIERCDDGAVFEILGIELVHARAVVGGAKIKIVAARPSADQADLGEIRPRATVRTASHTDDD